MSDFIQYDSDLGRDILYKPSQRVDAISSDFMQQLIAEMAKKMAGAGIGLAANQIGYPLQVFMIHFSPIAQEAGASARYRTNLPAVPFQVFINPRILAASTQTVSFWHGCLSALAHERGKVATYQWIDYEAFDASGQKIKGRLEDFAAVIFQHEFRHLLGRLYIDQTTTFMDHEALNSKFLDGSLSAYELCGGEVPHLLVDYKLGESIEDYAARLFP